MCNVRVRVAIFPGGQQRGIRRAPRKPGWTALTLAYATRHPGDPGRNSGVV